MRTEKELHSLYSKAADLVVDLTVVPESVPFSGNTRELIVEWARENPEGAERLAERLHQLLNQYYGQKGR